MPLSTYPTGPEIEAAIAAAVAASKATIEAAVAIEIARIDAAIARIDATIAIIQSDIVAMKAVDVDLTKRVVLLEKKIDQDLIILNALKDCEESIGYRYYRQDLARLKSYLSQRSSIS